MTILTKQFEEVKKPDVFQRRDGTLVQGASVIPAEEGVNCTHINKKPRRLCSDAIEIICD